MPELKQCETCGGSGKYRVWAMGEYRTGYMKCYSCNGGGKIKTEPKLPSIEDELRGENERLHKIAKNNFIACEMKLKTIERVTAAHSLCVAKLEKAKEAFLKIRKVAMWSSPTIAIIDKALKDIEGET